MAEQKQRHGCLTAWLIFMIVANSLAALFYLLVSSSIRQQLPNAPEWLFPVMGIGGLFNLGFAIALFKWKKWGFWGFCASSIVAFTLNLTAGLGIGPSMLGLIGVAVLYGVLQIGKEDKGWPQLD